MKKYEYKGALKMVFEVRFDEHSQLRPLGTTKSDIMTEFSESNKSSREINLFRELRYFFGSKWRFSTPNSQEV